MIFTQRFWRRSVVAAARTFSQATLSVLGGSAINIWQVDWKTAVGIGAGAAVISFLMSMDRVDVMPPKNPQGEKVDELLGPIRSIEYRRIEPTEPTHYELPWIPDGLPTAYPR